MPTNQEFIELLKKQYNELRLSATDEEPTYNPLTFGELLEKHRTEISQFLEQDGDRVSFLSNNLLYGQDFSASRGIPSDVPFKVEWFDYKKDRVRLVGPGYGAPGAYENGALFVFLTHAHEYSEVLRKAADLNSKKENR